MPKRAHKIPYNPRLSPLARELRKVGTLGEVLLWKELKGRALGYEFHRQVPVDEYIVDFYCHELMLAIEVDGVSHVHPEVGENDVHRQARLESLGVTVLRFNEAAVRKDASAVARAIGQWIEDWVNDDSGARPDGSPC